MEGLLCIMRQAEGNTSELTTIAKAVRDVNAKEDDGSTPLDLQPTRYGSAPVNQPTSSANTAVRPRRNVEAAVQIETSGILTTIAGSLVFGTLSNCRELCRASDTTGSASRRLEQKNNANHCLFTKIRPVPRPRLN